VAHGCQAGLQQKALGEVLYARIGKYNESYAIKELGAFGSYLGAFSCFFESVWAKPFTGLSDAWKEYVTQGAAFCLRALGRSREAVELFRTAVELCVAHEMWKAAAIRALNLSELDLTLGEVAGAVVDAERSVTYADRGGNAYARMENRAAHADALHQAGRRAEAETRFREAEQMQQKREFQYPLLYSVQGFKYCDLLLAAPERAAWLVLLNPRSEIRNPNLKESCRAVSQRAAQILEWRKLPNWDRTRNRPLDIAVEHLTWSRAALYDAILSNAERGVWNAERETARRELDAAVSNLRRANVQEFIVSGLLTRAWVRFLSGARIGPESAEEDLDEAWEMAERGPMKLHMVELHLHRARLFFREEKYPWESPAADLAAAEKLVNGCGYHRRDEELAEAQKAFGG
jgi:tetratricopeptide (TPR) repeat protein